MLASIKSRVVEFLIRYLTAQARKYEPFSVRFSTAIKYLTQSTWSHAAMYVGDTVARTNRGANQDMVIEAELGDGVIAVPLAKYRGFNTRICRPVGLTSEDRDKVVRYMIDSLGMEYDLNNVIDLARYLIPTPPVPIRWRRRMLALGSGDPTRVICSTRIAQAFQSVRYPILPLLETRPIAGQAAGSLTEIMHIRHYSLFTPRDFDLSPYFEVIKPSIEKGFDYQDFTWSGRPGAVR